MDDVERRFEGSMKELDNPEFVCKSIKHHIKTLQRWNDDIEVNEELLSKKIVGFKTISSSRRYSGKYTYCEKVRCIILEDGKVLIMKIDPCHYDGTQESRMHNAILTKEWGMFRRLLKGKRLADFA